MFPLNLFRANFEVRQASYFSRLVLIIYIFVTPFVQPISRRNRHEKHSKLSKVCKLSHLLMKLSKKKDNKSTEFSTLGWLAGVLSLLKNDLNSLKHEINKPKQNVNCDRPPNCTQTN